MAVAGAGDSLFDQGATASKAGDLTGAQNAYELCIQAGGPHATHCRIALAWGCCRNARWEDVIAPREGVRKIDPGRAKLARSLEEASGNKAGVEKMRAAARSARATLKVPTAQGQTLRFGAVGDIMLGTLFPAGYLPPD